MKTYVKIEYWLIKFDGDAPPLPVDGASTIIGFQRHSSQEGPCPGGLDGGSFGQARLGTQAHNEDHDHDDWAEKLHDLARKEEIVEIR